MDLFLGLQTTTASMHLFISPLWNTCILLLLNHSLVSVPMDVSCHEQFRGHKAY